MKAIGGILCALGLGVILYAAVSMMTARGAVTEAGARQLEAVGGDYLIIPMVFGIGALAVGMGLVAFGGKGYFRGRPPARPELT